MSRNQQYSSNVPDAGKLIDDDKCDLTDSRVDSGFISSGSLLLSGEISEEAPEPHPESFRQYRNTDLRSQSDSGIIEDKSEPMLIDSGICLTKDEPNLDKQLSSQLSSLKLQNDLNNPKAGQPPVESIRKSDVPWDIYFEQDEDGDTNLHTAVVHGFAEVALALIRAAPHPGLLDTANDAAQTPLHLAVETSQFRVARWLIIAGAKPNPRDAQGNSPLHLAARKGDLNCVKAITEPVNPKHREAMVLTYDKKISYETPHLDQWNYVGQTCVHVAARYGHLDVLRHLTACGADVNAREGLEGLSALHYAVKNGDERIVQYLLECPYLNADVRTYGGRNAWQWCICVPDPFCQLLRKKGLDSPFSSEDDDSSNSDDEEMSLDSQVHRFTPNLVNASA